MKKVLVFVFLIVCLFSVYSQVYNPVTNYYFNGTPTNGIKITTNIPFQHGLSMPTIIFEGYNYGDKKPMGIILNWYVYNNTFYNSRASSFGAYTPKIQLANEDGKIVIFLDERKYYNRISIRAYAEGKGETATMFENWIIEDSLLSGYSIVTVEYENGFAGNVNFPEGIWNKSGNVGIGTTILPAGYKLAVAGKILAEEIQVSASETSPWPDFVFTSDYQLKTLKEVECFIKENQHLPDVPSAEEIAEEGISMGEMNALLLQKIEELTLYAIEQDKRIKIQDDLIIKELESNKSLENRIEKLELIISQSNK